MDQKTQKINLFLKIFGQKKFKFSSHSLIYSAACLMVILNNHGGHTGWCCGPDDGEGLWYTTEYSGFLNNRNGAKYRFWSKKMVFLSQTGQKKSYFAPFRLLRKIEYPEEKWIEAVSGLSEHYKKQAAELISAQKFQKWTKKHSKITVF